MWQCLLLLVCLNVCEIRGGYSHGNQKHVEEKTLEKSDKRLHLINVVKRAVSDNLIGGESQSVTTQVPSNTAVYSSSVQTGSEGEVNVLQFNETTQANNVTESATNSTVTQNEGNTNAPVLDVDNAITSTISANTSEPVQNSNSLTAATGATVSTNTSTTSRATEVPLIPASNELPNDPVTTNRVPSLTTLHSTRVTSPLTTLATPAVSTNSSVFVGTTATNTPTVEAVTTTVLPLSTSNPTTSSLKPANPPASIVDDDKNDPGNNLLPEVTPATTSTTTAANDITNEIPASEPEPSPTPPGTLDGTSLTDNDTAVVEPESDDNSTTPEPTSKPTELPSTLKTTRNPTTPTSEPVQTSTTTLKAETPMSEPVRPTSTTPKVKIPTPEPDTTIPTSKPEIDTTTGEHVYPTFTAEPTETPTSEPEVSHSTSKPEDSHPTSEPEDSHPTSEPEDSHPTSEPEDSHPTSEPEDSHPTSEPEDSHPTSEPEDSHPTSEPEDSTEGPVQAEPEFNFDVFAEPGPDWPVAKREWKQAWEFHIYFFGIIFVLLGVYCLFCVIHLWKMDHLLSRHYFMTLQILVMLICIFRASYLLIDAYNSSGTFPIIVDYFLYSTVFPCLTAVFSILFYALLLAIRVRVISEKVQKLWVLLLIIGLHFALSFATDIIVGLYSSAAIMLLICQSFFILWGLIIFVGYLIIFKKLYTSAINRQEAMQRSISHERKNNITQGYQEKLPKQKYRLGLAVKVTLVSSFFGLACVCFELYGMFGVYGVMRVDKPQPWPWWIYHFILRCLEIAMCSSISFVASQPLKYAFEKKYKDHACLKMLPCRYLCSADVSSRQDEATNSADQYALSETDHLGWLKKLKLKKFSSPDTSAPYPPHAAEKYADPDATLLVRKINKPKPSMLVVEDGFVRIRREDEVVPSNQLDLDSNSRSSRSSDINNVSALPEVSYTVNERQTNSADATTSSIGISNAAFAQEDNRLSLQDENRISFHGDNRMSFQGDTDIADETDIDIAVTDCENSDGYDTPIPLSDDNSGNSGDIFRPLSDIDLAASMESELERAFHTGFSDNTDTQERYKTHSMSLKTSKKPAELNGQSHTDDDWSDSSDGPNRTADEGLLRKPIRRCKSAETKEQQKSKMFDKNRYFSLSSIDSVGKHEVQTTDSPNHS